jgi:hypothetical protein
LKSYTTPRFRQAFAALPEHVQLRARAAYRQFQQNPSHPGLRFKRVHASEPIYSARVGLGYRALAVLHGDVAIWFWIGTHAEYDQQLRLL